MTTACTQCGKRTHPDSIHTCSPQVQRDETLPEPTFYVGGKWSGHPDLRIGAHLYSEATLREAIKGARKKALSEAAIRAAIHSQYPVENDYDRGYGKSAKDAADRIRKLLEDL